MGIQKVTGMMKQKIRHLTQCVCAVLYNCHITGFIKGEIYQGNNKGVCVPGLNCYSCPGAIGACPIGSVQNALLSSKYRVPYYALGMILLFGILLGRLICGFLCPFGLLQEVLAWIPVKKIKKSRVTYYLSYLKYVILVVFCVLIPLLFQTPGFCKYICPAGTLEGGIPLVLLGDGLRSLIGKLFTMKMTFLVLILVGCIFLHRFFCRFLCPLGAFYSFFHKVAVVRMVVDESKCNGCGRCVKECPMDIRQVGDRECVYCMKCSEHCAQCAISVNLLQGRND